MAEAAGQRSSTSLPQSPRRPRGGALAPGAAASPRAGHAHDHDSFPHVASSDMGRDRPFSGQYHLFGVINHYGSISGGHYTAYAKVADRWCCFDDSYVSTLDASPCRKAVESGYVLFYRIR